MGGIWRRCFFSFRQTISTCASAAHHVGLGLARGVDAADLAPVAPSCREKGGGGLEGLGSPPPQNVDVKWRACLSLSRCYQ